MTELLKKSINAAFDLYKGHITRFYSFHISLLLLFFVLGAGITIVVSYPYVRLTDSYLMEQSVLSALTYSPVFYQVFNCTLILLFAIYSCLLPGLISGETRPTVGSFFKVMNGDRLTIAFIGLMLSIGLNILGYQLRKETINPDADLTNIAGATERFTSWAVGMLLLIARYSPYMSAYFVITHFVKQQDCHKTHISRLQAFGVMLMLSFCINVLWTEIASYLNAYVIKIPLIVFSNQVAEIVFTLAIYLALTPLFMPVVSAMLYYPIALNQVQELDEEDIAEGEIPSEIST